MAVSEPVGVALVGVGGQGATHLAGLQTLEQDGLVRLLAVCEAARDRWVKELAELADRGVAVEPDLATMLRNWQGRVSVVGVPVGIPAHRPVTVQAIEAGYHVVLEKPPVGCIDDLQPMLQAVGRSGRTCAVHFQSVWMRSLRTVKAVIVAGRIGKLREIRIKGRWFREDGYYSRNSWAGRLRVGDTWVLDGTINNPFAHQVNNSLFLAGAGLNEWANPTQVRAELYHARPGISGDDTTCLALKTDTGVDLKLWFTLCSGRPERQPTIRVIGEIGQIIWPLADGSGRISWGDSCAERIEPDNTPGCEAVYRNVCNYLLGREERILCDLADCRPFTQTVSAAYQVAGPPRQIPERFAERTAVSGKEGFVLAGVDGVIDNCFETGRLFSEAGAAWAVEPASMCLDGNYRQFRPSWT